MHPVERLTRHWKKRVRKEEAMSTNPQDGSQPTVVLVHGAWADGSGWQGVYNLLKDDYSVRIVQEPNPSSAAASPTRSIGAPAPRAT
jgi:hypothetical protein